MLIGAGGLPCLPAGKHSRKEPAAQGIACGRWGYALRGVSGRYRSTYPPAPKLYKGKPPAGGATHP